MYTSHPTRAGLNQYYNSKLFTLVVQGNLHRTNREPRKAAEILNAQINATLIYAQDPELQRSDAPIAFDVQSRQQGRISSIRDCGEIYLASRLPLSGLCLMQATKAGVLVPPVPSK